MHNSIITVWKDTLSEIKSNVSHAAYSTLFRETKLISIEGMTVNIAVKNHMVINMIRQKFPNLIKEILDKQLHQDTNIVYVPTEVQKQEKTNEQERNGLFFINDVPAPKPIGHLPRVRADFTFETLAVSESNRLAFVSSQNVAKNIGKSYNPLFIYGPVGVGKTHLMQAIANEVYGKNPDAKIIYITSEEFTNEVVEAIRGNDTAKMKKRFRSAKLLIIDDVQFIAGKDRVQEELFHTFNILIDNSAQIVLSSDRPPNEIKKLETRLSSRFAGGLTVDVEAPDFELRTAIVLKKAEKFGYPITIDVAKMIAEKEQDVRSLEGVLLRVITEATQTDGKIIGTTIEKALRNKSKEERQILHADDIIKAVCVFYTVKATQLKGPKRDASLVKPRQVAMYLLKKELGLPYKEIGNVLGGRDHSTVMYGVEKIEKVVDTKGILGEDIVGITKQLRG